MRFQNGSNKVAIELRGVQWLAVVCVDDNSFFAANQIVTGGEVVFSFMSVSQQSFVKILIHS